MPTRWFAMSRPVAPLLRTIVWLGCFSLFAFPAFAQQGSDASRLVGQVQNPTISPSNPDLIAYERLLRDAQELYLYNRRTGSVTRIQGGQQEGNTASDASFLNLFSDQDVSNLSRYDGQLAWRPRLDAQERQWFAFVSSGSGGGFDLHLSYVDAEGSLSSEPPIHLARAGTEQFPQWSPDGMRIAFVSGSENGSDLYLVPNVTPLFNRGNRSFDPQPLTASRALEFYPAWSPDGQYIAYQTLTTQNGRENWGISLVSTAPQPGGGLPEPIALTPELNTFDEYKPSWAPDGQHIAFYVSQGNGGSNSNSSSLLQDIGVLALVRSSGSDRVTGRTLAGFSPRLAQNVVPHPDRGPAWVPTSAGLQLLYVKRDAQAGFPIFAADFVKWQGRQPGYEENFSGQFGTQNHREPVMALLPGTLRVVFVSQEGNANKLQVFDLRRPGAQPQPIMVELSKGTAVRRSLLLPGMGQFYKGQKAKGALFLVGEVAALGAAAAFVASNRSSVSDAEEFRAAYQAELRTITDPNVTDAQAKQSENFRNWEQAHDDAEAAASMALVATAAAAGIWALNLLDSSLGFPRVVRRPARMASLDAQARPVFTYAHGAPQTGFSLRLTF